MSDDYDSPWKEALEFYLRDFMELLFPQAASEIDWSRGYEFLEQELQQITRDAETSRRTVDKLVRVYRFGGEEAWVLIHIEVQGQWEADFDERMFICHYRIFDLSKRPVASFVVYSDENPNWRPSQFGYELWGNRMQYEFPSAKLLDFLARWNELERSRSPIAVVIMTHLKTQQTRGDNDSRYIWKRRLAKMLHDRGFGRDDIRQLYRTIDWMMRLPKALDADCWAEIKAYEEEKKMPYITTAERVGREMGLAEGLSQGLRLALAMNLEQRLWTLSEEIKARLEKLSPEQLSALIKQSLIAPTMDDFIKQIPAAE